MIIQLKNIHKQFHGHVLFDKLNLEIMQNTISCIHGKSGSGKTTLLNIIGFLEDIDQGQILYDGVVITKQKQKRQLLSHRIAYIFQNFGLLENETVKENLLLIKRNTSQKKIKLIHKALEMFQLYEIENRKIYELSGGEQQRVALAKAVLKNADIILADEPTASLDKENKQIVLNSFRQFQKNGATILLVSHDQEVIDFSDIQIDLCDLQKGGE